MHSCSFGEILTVLAVLENHAENHFYTTCKADLSIVLNGSENFDRIACTSSTASRE